MAKRRTKGQVIIEYTVLFAIVAAVTALSTAAIFSRVCRSEGSGLSAFERYFQTMSQRIAPNSKEGVSAVPDQKIEISEEEKAAPEKAADALADAKENMEHSGGISAWRTRHYQDQIDEAIDNLYDNPDRFAPTVVNESFGADSNELEPY